MTAYFKKYSLLALLSILIICVISAVYFFIRADEARRDANSIISKVAEVQWRVSQIREKTVFSRGLVQLLAAKVNEQSNQKTLSNMIDYLAVNIHDLLSLSYSDEIMSLDDIRSARGSLAIVNERIRPLLPVHPDYTKVEQELDVLWQKIVPMTSSVSSMARARMRSLELSHSTLQNFFIGSVIIAFMIIILVLTAIYDRFRSKYDEHLSSFALLFSHMTYTRINALNMFLDEKHRSSSDNERRGFNLALQKVTELATVNNWLARMSFPRSDLDASPIVPLGDIFATLSTSKNLRWKPDVILSDEAKTTKVPQAQFQLVLEELIKNASEAMAGRSNPCIKIMANVTRNYFVSKRLNIVVEDNGTGMSKADLKQALTPFFSTKGEARGHAGLGLTGCARVIEAMRGHFKIVSAHQTGTTVTISWPLSSLSRMA